MKHNNRTSISLSDDELAILEAICKRLALTRSEVIRHFILYHGMCGGDFPLTSQILSLPEDNRQTIVQDIRRRAESNDPAKPQSFRKWVEATLGSADPERIRAGAHVLLSDLLKNASTSAA